MNSRELTCSEHLARLQDCWTKIAFRNRPESFESCDLYEEMIRADGLIGRVFGILGNFDGLQHFRNFRELV